MREAVELVQRSRKVLLSGHLRADGDCLGAQIVLWHVLRALGKDAEILLPDPPDGRYGFLQEQGPWRIYDGSLPAGADLLIVCDCIQLTRLGAMGENVARTGMARIAVDHHVMEGDQGWTALVHDVTAPASGLLALRFAEALGVRELPRAAYEAAFVALMTDTGWLKYSNATAEAWAAAAALVARGLDASRLHELVYQQAEPSRPAGVRSALENLEYHCDGRVAFAWSSLARQAEIGGSLEDTDEVLDLLRAVGRVEAVGFLTERPDGRIKVSFRSKHRLDVHRVAKTLGGGGHQRASGASFPLGTGLEEAVARARAALIQGFEALAAAPQSAR